MKDELPEAVIRRAQEGDEKAFEQVLDRYEALLCAVVARHFSQPQDQEEALAEVYLALVQSLPSYAFRSRFSTWLYGLAHRTCLRLWREQRRASSICAEEMSHAELEDAEPFDPEIRWEAERRRERLRQALEQLNGNYREVIRLRLEEGLSVEETAQRMGKSYTAVTTLLYRALKTLRMQLQEQEEDFHRGGDPRV